MEWLRRARLTLDRRIAVIDHPEFSVSDARVNK
jgi:hypothetical protein